MKRTSNKKALHSVQLITSALLRLMENETFEEITVSQLCQEAQVSRNAFYRNFNSRMDVLNALFRTKFEKLFALINEERIYPLNMPEHKDAGPAIRLHFKYWYNERDFLKILYRHRLFFGFQEEFSRNFNDYACQYYFTKNQVDPNEQEILYYQISSSFTGMLYMWTKHDFKESIDMISELFMLKPFS